MKYSDIVPSYNEYLVLQIGKWHSLESENPQWNVPQEEAIREFFTGLDPELSIADIACGDGFGLEVLNKMGFKYLIGIELNHVKASIADKKGFFVVETDVHDLLDIRTDVVYSSHTLEHCYYPGAVLDQFYKVLAKNGLLFVIVPYPDDGVDEAHGGKYELGTDKEDNFAKITELFSVHGFEISKITRGKRVTPEIRIWAKKVDKP
jgi:SAM-dependent methyltransferase